MGKGEKVEDMKLLDLIDIMEDCEIINVIMHKNLLQYISKVDWYRVCNKEGVYNE